MSQISRYVRQVKEIIKKIEFMCIKDLRTTIRVIIYKAHKEYRIRTSSAYIWSYSDFNKFTLEAQRLTADDPH